jgi:hypothetical protein
MATERDWRWCGKCEGLFFAGSSTNLGKCPAGGAHVLPTGTKYVLEHEPSTVGWQTNWRRCRKCLGMYFAGFPTSGHCPAGGGHVHREDAIYLLMTSTKAVADDATNQWNWRRCNRCQGIFYAGNQGTGHCPAGGGHNHLNSLNYMMRS